MDWTLLPCPNPAEAGFGISVDVQTWHAFLASVDAPTADDRYQKAMRSGCIDSLELERDLDYHSRVHVGPTSVNLVLTSKGIREASEAHQNKDRVSIHTYLPESLQGLSVEELSERVLESDDDWSEFNCAITVTSLNKKKYPRFEMVFHKGHYHEDRTHFTF